MVLSTPQGGSTLIKQQDTLQQLQGGSIFSKWLVVNQNHHIVQVKKVSGQPKTTRYH
jgi:hypothetical protein